MNKEINNLFHQLKKTLGNSIQNNSNKDWVQEKGREILQCREKLKLSNMQIINSWGIKLGKIEYLIEYLNDPINEGNHL